MTEPRTVTPHEEDMAWARAWLRVRDAGMDQQLLGHRLRRMHERRIGAFRWLIANDAPANRMAKRLELLDAGKASWEGIDAIEVRAKVRRVQASPMAALLGHFLATALRNHAPQHLALLPPAWLSEDDQQPPAPQPPRTVSEQLAAVSTPTPDATTPPPKAYPLSREQLSEAYRQAGVKGPERKPEPEPEAQPEVVPLRPAATPVHTEVRRGPVIDIEDET